MSDENEVPFQSPTSGRPGGDRPAGAEITIAGVQMNPQLGAPQTNATGMLAWLGDDRLEAAQVVVFPECAVTGYCFHSKSEAMHSADSIPGALTDRFTEAAARLKKHLLFGMLERQGDDLFNVCVLVGPNGLMGHYRKSHLPWLGVDRFVTRGDQPPPVFDLGFLRIGLHICYDASFPEATRLLMLEGADLAVLPTNWPDDARVFAEHLAPVRAMENHIYFMIVNRVGSEGGFEFIGQSQLCAPNGRRIAICNEREESCFLGTIAPDSARQKHQVRVPGQHEIHRLADRRADLYGRISQAAR